MCVHFDGDSYVGVDGDSVIVLVMVLSTHRVRISSTFATRLFLTDGGECVCLRVFVCVRFV
jgi:hypothetical protein